MKFKEFDVYHAYYCGLCHVLKERYGLTGQLSLSYDMTFLVLLLTSLYEPEDNKKMCKCIAHPFEKHASASNEYTEYVADMNIIFSYYKCMDDWHDEKKLYKKLYGDLMQRKSKKQRKIYEYKEKVIAQNLEKLSLAEKENSTDIDYLAACFGNILAELFAVYQDEWETSLRKIGFSLGKYIYILDAYDDLEKDEKKGNFNPFKGKENLDTWVKDVLTMVAADCAREFEKLPIIENVEILRNILYSGIWTKYAITKERRNQLNERSL